MEFVKFQMVGVCLMREHIGILWVLGLLRASYDRDRSLKDDLTANEPS